jgi:hypothetical protein
VLFPLPFVFRNYVYPLINTASGFTCQTSYGLEYRSTLVCYSEFTATETIPVIVSQTGTTTLGTATQSPPGGVNAYPIHVAIQIPDSSTAKANFPWMLS